MTNKLNVKKIRLDNIEVSASKPNPFKSRRDISWSITYGELRKKGGGRPRKRERRNLFSLVAEKIPFLCLKDLRKFCKSRDIRCNGIYVAFDSMGVPRYSGLGNIFNRLMARWKAHPDELSYFSFFVVKDRKHQREIETMLIRIVGADLVFNERKKRSAGEVGNVTDFELGTSYFLPKVRDVDG